MIENYINRVLNGDTIEVMSEMPEGWVDLIVTSPPYNVGIQYDTHNDEIVMDEYWKWSKKWLTEAYRLLKDDGRIAINIPYEVNVQDRGGRVFFASELYQVMKKVGFKFYGSMTVFKAKTLIHCLYSVKSITIGLVTSITLSINLYIVIKNSHKFQHIFSCRNDLFHERITRS